MIDIHIHCAPQKEDYGSSYICDPEEMLSAMDEMGISLSILMSCGESREGSAHFIGSTNSECMDICRKYPDRFRWMCNIDPTNPGNIQERLQKLKAEGAVGVGELMINEWMDSPLLTSLFDAAEKLSLPVLFHMSPEPGYSYGICDHPSLPLLEKTLKTNPALTLIGHSQVFWLEISGDCPKEGNAERGAYGSGKVKEGGAVIRLLENYPNLYCDLSAYSAYHAITRDPDFGISFLETFQDRLMYGSDATNRKGFPPLASFIKEAIGKLSQSAGEKIFHINAERVFSLACQL